MTQVLFKFVKIKLCHQYLEKWTVKRSYTTQHLVSRFDIYCF